MGEIRADAGGVSGGRRAASDTTNIASRLARSNRQYREGYNTPVYDLNQRIDWGLAARNHGEYRRIRRRRARRRARRGNVDAKPNESVR